MIRIKSEIESRSLIGKFNRFFSIRLASYLAKYNITANQITLFSFLFGIAAAFSFSIGLWSYNVLGIVFFLFSFFLDYVDGDLARLKKQPSRFGEWMDAVTGKIESVLLFLGICIGQARHYSPTIVWVLGFIAISGYYVSQSLIYKNSILSYKRKLTASGAMSNSEDRRAALSKNRPLWRKTIRELLNGGIFITYAIVLCAILNKMMVFLWFAAIYMWLDHVLQIYFNFKKLR